jgi:glutathione S-transferase
MSMIYLDLSHNPNQDLLPKAHLSHLILNVRMAPQITLYFLQASRCIRSAWQLHELGLDYAVKFSAREGGLAPPAFRAEVGGLGKFPTLVDGDVTVTESGNIGECVLVLKITCTNSYVADNSSQISV